MHALTLSFRFDHLPPEGRAFAGEIDASLVAESVKGLVGDLGYRATTPLKVEGTAWPARHDVVVHGRFQGVLGFDCVRCLAARTVTLDQTVQHVLVHRTAAAAQGEDEIEISDEDDVADEHAFDGENIALADIFREDLVLELPMNPTCTYAGLPECALAATTGEAATVDPRWAPLAALRAQLLSPGDTPGSGEDAS
jgi:uncharacterized metal-binding protein YceD (DUF177 family)